MALRAGTPLYTDTKSQYTSHTEATFHSASATAEACVDTKLITNPDSTGARSLQLRSILRMAELILVSTTGGCPLHITTTHSLSISMVPARVESAASAPDTLVTTTRATKTGKLVTFRSS